MQTILTLRSDDTEIDTAYDDGLVHGHGWASTEGTSGEEGIIAQAEQQPQAAWREDAPERHDDNDGYDDGLVHSHGWASSR